MTANVMASDRQLCLEAGMNDYVAKPLRPDVLFSALERACGVVGLVDGGVLPDLLVAPDVVHLDLKGALRDIGDPDLFATMAGMLVAEWDGHVGRVQKALAAGDAPGLRMHAHTLKSLLAMFHAEVARRRAMELENALMVVESVDWVSCQQLCAALIEEMACIRPLMADFVSTRLIP
jgi:HPt (histidine-containing phosphotransfer) domain-containing protein